jgi:hypothetical protein
MEESERTRANRASDQQQECAVSTTRRRVEESDDMIGLKQNVGIVAPAE